MSPRFCLILGAVFLTGIASEAIAQSPTLTTVYDFCSGSGSECSDAQNPQVGPIQASDGNFYGTTANGGANGKGAIFQVTPQGQETVLHSFTGGSDGGQPLSGLIEASDGNLYGSTTEGGTISEACIFGCGTVFRISLSGDFTILHSFAGATDGDSPGSLIQVSDGNLYGTASQGGADNAGIIFKLTSSGTYSVFHTFNGQSDGATPYAGLLQGSDGNLYGLTYSGASADPDTGNGVIFKIDLAGNFTPLYTFLGGTDGAQPFAALTEGSDGNFYGNTSAGGTTSYCSTDNFPNGCGTIFSVTPAGKEMTLHAFCSLANCADGTEPRGALSVGTDGYLYGTVPSGGTNNLGTVFQLASSALNTLYDFSETSGYIPGAGLVQGNNGSFYGVTIVGGTGKKGTIFQLTLSPSLQAPVQLSLSQSSIEPDDSVTLSWKVLGAYSKTLQQCYAFVQNSPTGAGNWTGLQTGTVADGAYQGATSLTPTAAGVYTYALTCGGVESGSAILRVGDAKAPTATVLQAPSSVVLGSLVTLTASSSAQLSLGALTGSVTFSADGLSLGTVKIENGSASLNLQAAGIPTGTYMVTATYSGDINYQSSAGTATVKVLGYSTATTLSITPTTLIQGQDATLSTTVTRTSVNGTPAGTVTFYSGSVALGSAKLSGGHASVTVATGSYAPGSYNVTAKYSGDATDQSSTSSPVAVTLKAATSTTLTVTPNPVPANSAVSLTAKVKQTYGSAIATGTVTFSVGGTVAGTAALDNTGSGSVDLSSVGIAPGTYPVTASYSGDAMNGASSSPAVSVKIN
jgi:uncharacterized repeat protein (TIGR03803 family)